MSRPAFFLAMEPDCWIACRVLGETVETREVAAAISDPSSPGPQAPGPEPAVQALKPQASSPLSSVATVLRELGYRGEGLCLGLPSSCVLAGRVDVSNLPRRQKRTALLYRLEDQLPLAVESLTADFLPPVAGATTGLAVETARLKPILDDLAAAGIDVACLCPTVLLALWAARPSLPKGAEYAAVATDHRVDLLRLGGATTERSVPTLWSTVPAEGPALARAIQADLLARPTAESSTPQAPGPRPAVPSPRPAVAILGSLDADTRRQLADETGLTLTSVEGKKNTPLTLAALGAGRRLAGDEAGWVDFRQGDLAAGSILARLGRPFKIAVALAAAFLIVASGLMIRRAAQYASLADERQQAQADLYTRVNPTGGVPEDIRERLQEQYARLRGVRGEGAGLPARLSALEALRIIIARLPGELRVRLTSVQINETGIVVRGQARSHSDAQTVAQALTQGGFAVEPPSTESLVRGGVSFTLTGKPTPELLAGKPTVSKPQAPGSKPAAAAIKAATPAPNPEPVASGTKPAAPRPADRRKP